MSEKCGFYQKPATEQPGTCQEAARLSRQRKGHGMLPFDETCTSEDQQDCQRVRQGEWQPIEAKSLPPEEPDSVPPQFGSRCYRAYGGASQNRIENQ